MVATHVAAQFDSYRRHMVEGTDQPPPRPVDADRLRSRVESRHPLDAITYGTPDEVATQIRAASDGAPVETVFLWASIAGMPEDVVARNVRSICNGAGRSGGRRGRAARVVRTPDGWRLLYRRAKLSRPPE